ncbi:MAG TPA: hypothetical protein VHW00_25290 [Thermoanaerobaculia bacterium]|nr:hypothetical protein [Thermoanaerobaculia bacterium]
MRGILHKAWLQSGFIALAMLILSFINEPARAMPSLCGETGECVCITWIAGGSATVEVRCPSNSSTPSGWTQTGDPKDADGSDGSFGGNGQKQTPPSQLPGMPTNSATSIKLNPARTDAIKKLKGDQDFDDSTGKPIFTPNACSDLFLNSPMSTSTNPYPGAQLLGCNGM